MSNMSSHFLYMFLYNPLSHSILLPTYIAYNDINSDHPILFPAGLTNVEYIILREIICFLQPSIEQNNVFLLLVFL